MTGKVSKSETGQGEPVPSRSERDAAFSAGGGRKAAEETKHSASEIEPPIGLDMETRGDEKWSAEMSAEGSDTPTQKLDERKPSDNEDVPEDDGTDIEG